MRVWRGSLGLANVGVVVRQGRRGEVLPGEHQSDSECRRCLLQRKRNVRFRPNLPISGQSAYDPVADIDNHVG